MTAYMHPEILPFWYLPIPTCENHSAQSRTLRALFNSPVISGDIEKWFRIFLSELYNNTASGSIMVAEVVVRLTVPLAAWEGHDATEDWIPYLSAASRHAFKFVEQLYSHINVGTFYKTMVKWMVLVEWSIPSIVAILK